MNVIRRTQVCPRHEGGGAIAPALGGGSGANRAASVPVKEKGATHV